MPRGKHRGGMSFEGKAALIFAAFLAFAIILAYFMFG